MPAKPKSTRRKPGGREPAVQVNGILLAALAGGMTQQEAAAKAGVSVDLVVERMKDPVFRAQLEAIQNEIIERTIGKAVSASTTAIDKLVELIAHEDATISIRAATTVLDQTMKLRDAHTNAKRLAEIEAALRQREAGHAT